MFPPLVDRILIRNCDSTEQLQIIYDKARGSESGIPDKSVPGVSSALTDAEKSSSKSSA